MDMSHESDVLSNCDAVLGKKGVQMEDESAYDANYGAHKPGIKPEDMVDYYNTWKTYDEDLCEERYKGPQYAAQFAGKYLSKNYEAKILDVGAGTGRIGKELNNLGFSNLYALEPAQQLFDKSPTKIFYKQCIYALLGNDTKLQIQDDEYDAIVVSGAFGEGHIPCQGLKEMIRTVRPGGVIIIVMRAEYLTYVQEYINRLEPFMQELQEHKKWKTLEKTKVENYSFKKDGHVYVYEVMEPGFTDFKSSIL